MPDLREIYKKVSTIAKPLPPGIHTTVNGPPVRRAILGWSQLAYKCWFFWHQANMNRQIQGVGSFDPEKCGATVRIQGWVGLRVGHYAPLIPPRPIEVFWPFGPCDRIPEEYFQRLAAMAFLIRFLLVTRLSLDFDDTHEFIWEYRSACKHTKLLAQMFSHEHHQAYVKVYSLAPWRPWVYHPSSFVIRRDWPM